MNGLHYTLCFCRWDDKVLMLHRNRPPNKDLWNGVGGKIEPGESTKDALHREVFEETGINLHEATKNQFAGVVTWTNVGDIENRNKGMYVYIADFPGVTTIALKSSEEGLLEWKNLNWVCNKTNQEVVGNIPIFLPQMIASTAPQHYHFIYEDKQLNDVQVTTLKMD